MRFSLQFEFGMAGENDGVCDGERPHPGGPGRESPRWRLERDGKAPLDAWLDRLLFDRDILRQGFESLAVCLNHRDGYLARLTGVDVFYGARFAFMRAADDIALGAVLELAWWFGFLQLSLHCVGFRLTTARSPMWGACIPEFLGEPRDAETAEALSKSSDVISSP
jgi:hypothetical protein